MAAGYVVVEMKISDPEQYKQYMAAAPATIAAAGGEYLVRGGKSETLEGGWSPVRVAILKFPSYDQAKAWWSSPEYAAAKAIRQACAATEMIVADGVPS